MPSKGSTTSRGLGWKHQQNRERLLRRLRPGEQCWWCGRPMDKTMRLDADHGHSRHHGGSKADRLMHSRCNRQRHEGDNDDRRPALDTADAFTPRPIQLLDGTDDPRWPGPTRPPDVPVTSGFDWGAVSLN